MRHKKIAASAVALTMFIGTAFSTGCGKKPGGNNAVVSADSVWYDIDKQTLELDYDMSLFDYLFTSPLGETGDYLALESTAFYVMSGDDIMTSRFVDYYAIFVDIYDKTGEHVNSIDVVDLLSNSAIVDDYVETMYGSGADETAYESALSSFWSGGVCIVGDQIRASVTFDGATYSSVVMYTAYIDPITSEVTYELTDSAAENNVMNEAFINFGDYQVETMFNFSTPEDPSYILNIYDESGLYRTVDLSVKLPDVSIQQIESILRIDENTLLAKYYPLTGPISFFTLDIQTGDVHDDLSGDYEWLKSYNTMESTYIEGLGSVILDDEGIKTINYDSMTLEEAFSFDSCNVNRGDIPYLKLVSYSEDEIIMVGSVFKGNLFNNTFSIPQMVVLTKADSNPNAGKTILTAATVGSIDYAMSEAVCIFNETNPDYFIQFDNRYKADNHIDNSVTDYTDSDAYDQALDEATIELSNQLAVDLMAGDGPDIIFDTASLSQLNNDDYLIDLSGRINTDGLFANIVEASKVDGKLYQMPLTFAISGIAVLNDDVRADQTGFTLDEYGTFVSTVCNGNDPLAMDQTEFFITCLDAMGDQFITDDGNIDYDNDAFRSLAEYTNENVFPPIEVYTEEDYIIYEGTTDNMVEDGAVRIDASTFDLFVALLGNHADNSTILGIPSIDGRGPIASISSSVAISATSSEVDACWAFVETLLSPEVQEYYAISGKGCPLSVSAYESFAQAIVDDYNIAIEQTSRYMSPEAMAVSGPHMTEIDYAVVDNYENMILSCSAVSSTDLAISVIIREEMPGYFTGQKTLDEVISIIENRVQTFLDERG